LVGLKPEHWRSQFTTNAWIALVERSTNGATARRVKTQEVFS
jgi:hypothetical protein